MLSARCAGKGDAPREGAKATVVPRPNLAPSPPTWRPAVACGEAGRAGAPQEPARHIPGSAPGPALPAGSASSPGKYGAAPLGRGRLSLRPTGEPGDRRPLPAPPLPLASPRRTLDGGRAPPGTERGRLTVTSAPWMSPTPTAGPLGTISSGALHPRDAHTPVPKPDLQPASGTLLNFSEPLFPLLRKGIIMAPTSWSSFKALML